jgi:homoserine dehydrogenase
MSPLKINVVLFGIGSIGSSLIQEIIKHQTVLFKDHNIDLRIPIIANSTLAFIEKKGVKNNWEADFTQFSTPYTLNDLIQYTSQKGLENLIAIDTTKGAEFVKSYIELIQNEFDILTTNPIANSLHSDFYGELRRNLKKFHKEFKYESYLNPGLDTLDILKNLSKSGEKITKIKAVLSQSTSHILSNYENGSTPFSTLLDEAKRLGFATNNYKDDLTGLTISQKLIIIARELGKKIELKDVTINSLLPETIHQNISKTAFNKILKKTDVSLEMIKNNLSKDFVIRYIGELDFTNNIYEVKLVAVPKKSNMGQLKPGEKLVEIYSEQNQEFPMVIKSEAVIEKQLVVRHLLNDILTIARNKNKQNLACA